MIKAAVFENEAHLINAIFDTVNFAYFDNNFQFDYFPSSQALAFEKIPEYDLIIVDIDLSKRSELDGYGLISKINTLENHPPILILTGHSHISDTLKKKGLPQYPILTKAIGIEDTKEALAMFYKKV